LKSFFFDLVRNFFEIVHGPFLFDCLNIIIGAFNVEMWRRKNSKLAFLWNCQKFEEFEVDLPEYTKIKKQRDKMKPHSKLTTIFYANEVTIKSLVSFIVFLGMVSIILH